MTRPPTSLGGPVCFSEEDLYSVHFPQNDTLIITAHIGCCKVSKIQVDRGSSINIIYVHALDRMEDAPELARKLIIPRTQSLLYAFDRNKVCSPSIVEFPVRADLFNIVTEFCILDVPSPYNTILERPWIHMMRAVSSIHHQLPKCPTSSGMANIRGDQALARTVVAATRKRSGWMQEHPEQTPIKTLL